MTTVAAAAAPDGGLARRDAVAQQCLPLPGRLQLHLQLPRSLRRRQIRLVCISMVCLVVCRGSLIQFIAAAAAVPVVRQAAGTGMGLAETVCAAGGASAAVVPGGGRRRCGWLLLERHMVAVCWLLAGSAACALPRSGAVMSWEGMVSCRLSSGGPLAPREGFQRAQRLTGLPVL